MLVKLDKPLLNLRGEPLGNTCSEVLADILSISITSRPAQMLAWAIKLVNEGEIEVNLDDIDFIKNVVAQNQTTIDLARAQIIDWLEKYEEAALGGESVK